MENRKLEKNLWLFRHLQIQLDRFSKLHNNFQNTKDHL